jgi:Ca-activated chloride channel homolog
VGRGNLNDVSLEQIANNSNGTYEYIDTIEQLKKVLIYEFSKFYTVAKDVKVQVIFNSDNEEAYGLIGYENRLLNQEDITDDTAAAGEIGANQSITALYEIIPKSNPFFRNVPNFPFDFRYKNPNAAVSIPMVLVAFDAGDTFAEALDFMKFTAGVASFSM